MSTDDSPAPSVQDLGSRLEFETLISDTSASLFAVPPEQLERAVERALDRVRIFFQADRCGLLSVSPDQQVATIRLQSCADGVSRAPMDMNMAQVFPWSARKLLVERAPVRVSRMADLPPDADVEREAWTQMPIRSALVLPVETGGTLSHLIVLNAVHQEREWPDPFVTRLRVLGEMLAGALQRQEMFTGLREAEERVTLAADSAEAALWTLDYRTGVFWGTERARAIFGFLPGEVISLARLEASVHPDDWDLVRGAIEQSTRAEGLVSQEYRIILPADGRVRWIASRARSHLDSTGNPDRLMGVSIDVTERRGAEEALRRSLAEIEQLKDRLQAESEYLKAEVRVTQAQGELTGRSAAIQKVLRLVEQVAPTGSSVLLSGETGCGKELVAQAIHRLSPRRSHVMVKVNCAALPSGLVESELFGREKGAFTGALTRQVGRFEVADGSTIFLDEIGELSLEVQAKLLRVLEAGEFERLGSPRTVKVDVRLIAATNRDLADAIRQGRFREDLYYRLNVFPIRVPPLRERPEDIPPLVWAFLRELNSRMGKRITQVPRKTMEALQGHPWPGNVRELRNVIEHGAIVTTGDTLRVPMLDDEARSVAAPPRTLAEAEREIILRTLERTSWHIKGPKGAAAELGLHPATLYGRMKKLGIQLQLHRSTEQGS